MSAPKAPAGLGACGRALWRDVTSQYTLRADEQRLLESACRATDLIEQMEIEREGAVTAEGSMGQLVVHPLVTEIRAQHAQRAALLAKLKLPDMGGGVAEIPRSTQAREAAKSRWAVAHGAAG